jgi:hypothetical protein
VTGRNKPTAGANRGGANDGGDAVDPNVEPFMEHLRRKNPERLAELESAGKREREAKKRSERTLDDLCADPDRPWAAALLGVGPADMKRFVYSEIPEKDRRRAESMFLPVRCRIAGTIECVIRRERYLPYSDLNIHWVEVTLDGGDGRTFVFKLPKSLRKLVGSIDELRGMPIRLVGTIKVDGRQRFPARLFSLKYPSNVERDVIIPRKVAPDQPDTELAEIDDGEPSVDALAFNARTAELEALTGSA